MNKSISIILIIVGIGLGIFGFNKMSESTTNVEIGPIELSATDGDGKKEAYVLLGIGAICLVGALVTITKK